MWLGHAVSCVILPLSLLVVCVVGPRCLVCYLTVKSISCLCGWATLSCCVILLLSLLVVCVVGPRCLMCYLTVKSVSCLCGWATLSGVSSYR